MLESVLSVAVIVWFMRQFYGARAERWHARGRAWVPVGKVVAQDAHAVGRMVAHPFLVRREIRGADLDTEWRDLADDR